MVAAPDITRSFVIVLVGPWSEVWPNVQAQQGAQHFETAAICFA